MMTNRTKHDANANQTKHCNTRKKVEIKKPQMTSIEHTQSSRIL